MKRLKDKRGFSLAEIIVVVFIVVILFDACLMVLSASSDSWNTNKVQIDLEQNLRRGMEWMKLDLQQTGSSVITNVPADGQSYSTITFQTCSGVSNGSITWNANSIQYLKGGTNNKQLLRRVSGVDKILADNINSLTFKRTSSASNLIQVAMTAQKNTVKGKSMTATLNFNVKIRN